MTTAEEARRTEGSPDLRVHVEKGQQRGEHESRQPQAPSLHVRFRQGDGMRHMLLTYSCRLANDPRESRAGDARSVRET